MDLREDERQQALRREVRAWLRANLPAAPLPSFDTPDGFAAHRDWERRLAAGGWSVVSWPEVYGGRGLGIADWLLVEEEYWGADAPGRVNQNGLFLLGPTLQSFGSEAQKARFLPPMAAGEEIWAQAWSEPGAGSDMAAIRSHARRDGDDYVISGQKIWSTRAVFADWCFGLFRSDPDSARHRGLSFLLVPLDAPGVRVRPIAQLDGLPGFAEIFFDEVRVPAANRVGAEGEGWRIAMQTAGFERGLLLRSPARFQRAAERLLELYRRNRHRADATLEQAVLRAWMDAEAYALAAYRTAARLAAGETVGAEASANKIFWSELDRELHAAAIALIGSPPAEDADCSPEEAARWRAGYLFSLAGPIYAGTNEIQRAIIATRVLGLPKAG